VPIVGATGRVQARLVRFRNGAVFEHTSVSTRRIGSSRARIERSQLVFVATRAISTFSVNSAWRLIPKTEYVIPSGPQLIVEAGERQPLCNAASISIEASCCGASVNGWNAIQIEPHGASASLLRSEETANTI